MKIIMTVPDIKLSSGGPPSSVVLLADSIALQGIDLSLFAMDYGDEIYRAGHSNAFELRLIQSKKSRIGAFRAIGKLKQEITAEFHRHRNVVLHDHSIWSLFNNEVVRTCITNRIPYLISAHGMLEPWSLEQRRQKKRLAWFLYQHKNLSRANILYATAYQEAMGLRRIGLTNPIAIIPNIIETPPLLTEQPKDNGKKKTALFLSRIHPKKGLPNLIEAWNRIRPADWQLMIAGPDHGGHEDYLKSLVNKYGLGKEVQFLGPIYNEEKWRLFRKVDLFVLPTFSENFGLVVGEALSMAVPTITTKGAPWQDLETFQCGWWIDIGLEPLITALKQAFEISDKTRSEMGARGKKLIEEKYSPEMVAKNTIAVYEWILGGGNPPSCVMTE